MPHILVCEYSSRVCNCYAKFTYGFFFLGLPHSSSSIVRTRIARGCQAATRTTSVSEVLYAASDFLVMTVVVPLLVALDDIHHRAGEPRAQFHCHADSPCELPELQVSSTACLAALSSRSVTPARAIPTTSVSAVQPRIKLSVRLAVVLLLYTSVECLRQPAFGFSFACCSLGCTL